LPVARRKDDGTMVYAQPIPREQFHAFISHQWESQDQARVIKSMLQQLIPGIHVFLECVACLQKLTLVCMLPSGLY
jgi:hypothetical protein